MSRVWDIRGHSILRVSLPALSALMLSMSLEAGGAEEVILEDFTQPAPPGLVLANTGAGDCGTEAAPWLNAACIDDAAGSNGGPGSGRLLLTMPFPRQRGHAWFDYVLDLDRDRITAEFDLLISGGTTPPGDGVSAIFQLGTDTAAIGRPGGSLGTGGLPARYIAVAFDLWDDGEHDPESPCDSASPGTCHVEVNQDGDPATEPSIITSIDVPDFAAAGNAGFPVHVSITLDGREIAVSFSTAHESYGTRTVIHGLLPEGPDRPGIFGFAASTSGAAALHAIDNVRVTHEPAVPPVIAWEPPVEEGGIDCGGEGLVATVDGSPLEIACDCPYGRILEVMPGPPTMFLLSSHGRISSGDDQVALLTGPISNLSDPSLEPLYLTEAWSRKELVYRHNVPPGRYAMTLHVAESCPCGIGKQGEGLRRYDVKVGGSDALLSFSPGEAAGEAVGSCSARLATAVTRSFETDAIAGEDGISYLEVRVKDLGGGTPPENAQLNGFTFRRIGDATGAPLSGAIEDRRSPTADSFDAPRVLVDLDFEGLEGTSASEALAGIATVNPGRFFRPEIGGGRLRLADDSRIASATSVLFDGGGSFVFDPLAVRLRAELDVFISNPDEDPPAEGFVLAVLAGRDPQRVGGPGGGLGFGGLSAPGIGVEIDLWQGGGFGDDSGYNTDGQGHIAIVGSGQSPATVDHVQDQNDLDPALDGADAWVDWLAPSGFHLEVLYDPQARIEVFLSSLDDSFPRTRVLDSYITPFQQREALLGLFAATGGETATLEVDNVLIEIEECIDLPEEARIAGPAAVLVDLGPEGRAEVELDGSPSTPGEGEDGQELRYRWTLTGPFAGGAIERTCDARTRVEFTVPGFYRATLEVDDGRCTLGELSSAALEITVRDLGGGTPFLRADTNCDLNLDISDAVNTLNALFLGTGIICCDDAADTNDDGDTDISDPVSTLNYLFLGALPPAEPFPLCGSDPTEDALGCESPPACE